jgi:hypothetical protein
LNVEASQELGGGVAALGLLVLWSEERLIEFAVEQSGVGEGLAQAEARGRRRESVLLVEFRDASADSGHRVAQLDG